MLIGRFCQESKYNSISFIFTIAFKEQLSLFATCVLEVY